MNVDDLKTAADLASLSEDELLVLVAEETRPGLFQIDERSDEEKRKSGRGWLEAKKAKLCTVLCRPELTFLRPPPGSERERALMICALADVIMGVEVAISPFTAAALVLWYGLDKLCGDS